MKYYVFIIIMNKNKIEYLYINSKITFDMNISGSESGLRGITFRIMSCPI